MKVRTLIVDDEELARERLHQLLAELTWAVLPRVVLMWSTSSMEATHS